MIEKENRFLHAYLLFIFGFSVISSVASAYEFQHPGGITTKKQIQTAAKKIKQGNLSSKWKRLVRAADSRLREPPSAVKNLSIPAYYKDQSGSNRAAGVLEKDVWSAYSAAAVYAVQAELSGQKSKSRYADQTIRILNDWAWTNRGFSGENAGLTPSLEILGLIQAAEFVYHYPGWKARDRAKFLNWVSTVAYEQAGIKYRGKRQGRRGVSPRRGGFVSNWNDWGIVTALSADHLTNDGSRFAQDAALLEELIAIQIEPDGRLPGEIRRGVNGIVYTSFALEPMTAAVEIVRNAGGRDLRHWKPKGRGSIKDALNYLYQSGFENPSRWPVAAARRNSNNDNLADELFAAMYRIYGVKKWGNFHRPDFPDLWTGGAWALPEFFEPTP